MFTATESFPSVFFQHPSFSAHRAALMTKNSLDFSTQEHTFLFSVKIPWPLLHLWNGLQGGSNGSTTYIDLLNSTVVDGWFALRRNCERVETLLVNKAYEVNLAYRKTTGRKRKQLDDKVYKLSIRRNETETMESLKSELEKSRAALEEGKQKYIDLEAEKEKLYEQLKKEIKKLQI